MKYALLLLLLVVGCCNTNGFKRGDRVKHIQSGRTGTVLQVYCEAIAVSWSEKEQGFVDPILVELLPEKE